MKKDQEKTDRIFHPRYKVQENFMVPPKELYDKSDHGFRKYKKYEEFTKAFDKTTNLEVGGIIKPRKDLTLNYTAK